MLSNSPRVNDLWRGLSWTILSTLLGSTADIIMRTALDHGIPRIEAIFTRGAFALLWLTVALTLAGEWRSLRLAMKARVVMRSFCDAFQTMCFVIALSTTPFAIATAGFCTLPIWMTVLAALFLKEKVRWRRWGAAVAGFCGMFLIAKPAGAGFDSFALFGVATGLLVAGRDIFTRQIGSSISAWTLTFLSTIVILFVSLAASIFEVWRPLTLEDGYLLVGASLLQVSSTYALICGLRAGEVSVTATFRYLFLVWALLAGYFFFGEVVDGLSLIGVILIFAAGIYTAWREATLHKRSLAASLRASNFS